MPLSISDSDAPLIITPIMAVKEFQNFSRLVNRKSSSRVPRPKNARIASGRMKKESRRVCSKTASQGT